MHQSHSVNEPLMQRNNHIAFVGIDMLKSSDGQIDPQTRYRLAGPRLLPTMQHSAVCAATRGY